MKPIARSNDLIVERHTAEIFIKDVLNNSKIYLNPTSAYVWEKCDGNHETNDIVAEMSRDLGMSVSERFIISTLNHLQSKRILNFI